MPVQNEAEARYRQLSFSPPAETNEFAAIEGFSVSFVPDACKVFVGMLDHLFHVEISLRIKEIEEAIRKELLSDWRGEDGVVELKFQASEIYDNGMPTGAFQLQKGKLANGNQARLQSDNFQYSLGFDGIVYLQEGWIGIDGWLQDEFDTRHAFRIQVYRNIAGDIIDWTAYRFSVDECECAPPEYVCYLNYSKERITSFPEKITACENLVELSLHGGTTEWRGNAFVSTFSPVAQLPEALGRLENLTSLTMTHLGITSLPESLGNLRNLQKLHIYSCTLNSLPDSIFQLPRLRFLSIGKTAIQQLPPRIDLPELRSIHLKENTLTTLPESICQQTNLTSLSLQGNPWQSLPQALGDSRYSLELSIEEKQRLLDFSYKGADGKGTVAWDDSVFRAGSDAQLIRPVKNIVQKNNLEEYQASLLAMSKRAIGFQEVMVDHYATVGNTRFGGFPDLPRSIPYPEFYSAYDARNFFYEFIAQVNCSAIAHLQNYLPRTGMLYFFLGSVHMVYDGREAAKVIWFDGDEGDLQTGKHLHFDQDSFFEVFAMPPYTPHTVEAFAMVDVPDLYAYAQNRYWFAGEGGERLYQRLAEEEYGDSGRVADLVVAPVKKLKEYNYAINSYMFTQHESPELQASLKLKGNPGDWIILLQVSSSADFQWGDAGDLAFVIHKSDLAKCDFSNIFCTIESS